MNDPMIIDKDRPQVQVAAFVDEIIQLTKCKYKKASSEDRWEIGVSEACMDLNRETTGVRYVCMIVTIWVDKL